MDTQKLNDNKAPKKGMKPSTAALAGSGIAAGVIAGTAMMADQGTQNEQDPEEIAQIVDPNEQNNQEEQNQQTEQQEQPQPQQQEANVTEPTPIAPDQPGIPEGDLADNTASVVTDDNTVTTEPVDPAEAEALAIAQHLVSEDEIDANDIDAPSMAFVDTDVIYDEDGTEIPVALVSMPDSDEPFLLADIDGDRVYDYLVDSNGNIVSSMGNSLNIDDAEFALNDDNTYLAANEDSIQILENEDISDDILVLGDGDLVAEVDYTHSADEPSMDDEYLSPDAVLADSDPLDDILSDIGYDAPDEG